MYQSAITFHASHFKLVQSQETGLEKSLGNQLVQGYVKHRLCLCHFICLPSLFSKTPVDESPVTSLGSLCKYFTHLESIFSV